MKYVGATQQGWPLNTLAQSGAAVGDALVWDGEKWAPGIPPEPLDPVDAAYVLIMSPASTGADLESFLQVPANYLAFPGIFTHATYWPNITSTATAMQVVADSQSAMNLLVLSSEGMDTVVASSTAMGVIANTETAFSQVLANAGARGKVIGSNTALATVLATPTAVSTLVNDSAAMAEVAASSTAMAAVAASSTAMAACCYSQTAIDALVAVSNSWAAFKASTALPVASIPTMTSNTTPSGTASSSTTNSSYPAWYLFDKSTTNRWMSASGQTSNQWVRWFRGENWFVHTASLTGYSTILGIKEFRIEYSADNGATWNTAYAGQNPLDLTGRVFDIAVAGKYEWRLFVLNNYGSATGVSASEFNLTGFLLP